MAGIKPVIVRELCSLLGYEPTSLGIAYLTIKY